MVWVYIENGVVKDKVAVPPSSVFHPAYADMFVEAPDDVDHGWLWDGETFTSPPSPPPPVPQSVSMRQARLALLSYGLLDDVDSVIIAMTEAQRAQTQIEWEYAQTVERDNALVAALGPKLGLDDAAIDSLFSMAATL